MPLTTTATWPTLTDGRKAKASEVEAKFDWLEGAQLPMINGAMTTGVYDIGSLTYKWNNGYFNSVVIGSRTMTSAEAGGTPLRSWALVDCSGGTATAMASFNVSGIWVFPTVGSVVVEWDTNFSSANYAVVATPFNAYVITSVPSLTAQYSVVKTTTPAGVYTAAAFSILAVGDQ